MEFEPLYSTGEAARVLWATTKTVTRWGDAGKIRMTRTLGGHRRYVVSSVEAYRKELEVKKKRKGSGRGD